MTKTRSGRISKRPSHLKGAVWPKTTSHPPKWLVDLLPEKQAVRSASVLSPTEEVEALFPPMSPKAPA